MNVMKQGSVGVDVFVLQQDLIKGGYLTPGADGLFGPQTEAAVKAFQSAQGLAIDGVVGPLTLAALGIASAAPAPFGKIKIIDVSHWESAVDYAQVAAAGYLGVIAKATQGISTLDNRYAYHKAGAKAAGLPFGSFHFMNYLSSGADQARWYVKNAKGTTGLFCCDAEQADGKQAMDAQVAKIVREFIDETQQLTGKRCKLYSDLGFLQGYGGLGEFSAVDLWIADYSKPMLPDSWTSAWAWQYTGGNATDPMREDVPGAGFIDVSWFYGSKEDFARECAL